MKKINTIQIAILLVLMFIITDALAQTGGGFGNLDGIGFDDDVNDQPVPIFGHLFVAISALIGSFLGYRKLKK